MLIGVCLQSMFCWQHPSRCREPSRSDYIYFLTICRTAHCCEVAHIVHACRGRGNVCIFITRLPGEAAQSLPGGRPHLPPQEGQRRYASAPPARFARPVHPPCTVLGWHCSEGGGGLFGMALFVQVLCSFPPPWHPRSRLLGTDARTWAMYEASALCRHTQSCLPMSYHTR